MPYKIVLEDSRKIPGTNQKEKFLCSAYPSDTGDCTQEYVVGVPTKVDPILESCGYGLCVFDSLETAMEFFSRFSGGEHKLFECETTGTDRAWWGLTNGALRVMFNRSMLNRMHKLEYGGCFIPPRKLWPKGTLMADSVTLIREVIRHDDQSNVA